MALAMRYEQCDASEGVVSVPYLVSEGPTTYRSAREFQRTMVKRVRAAGTDPRVRFRLIAGGIEYLPRTISANGESCTVVDRVTIVETAGAA